MSGKLPPHIAEELGEALREFMDTVWPEPTQPTAWAAAKIPEIRVAAAERRRKSQRVTRQGLATDVGVNRETLAAWIEQGWLEWEPHDPADNPA